MQKEQEKLQNLYAKREEIEKEIQKLEKILSKPLPTMVRQTIILSKSDKISIFRSLFIGRSDIYAKEWISNDGTKRSYYNVTKSFKGQDYIPVSNSAIEQHLRGIVKLATYPILNNNKAKYLVLSVQNKDLQQIKPTLDEYKINGYFELNEQNDFYIWIFFEGLIEAKRAKALGEKLLSKANIKGSVYPNQDFANKVNFGAYLPLPLHLQQRDKGKTVFIDVGNMKVVTDQWQLLNSVEKLSFEQLEKLVDIEKSEEPWKVTFNEDIEFPMQKIKITLFDSLYIQIEYLSVTLIKYLKKLATFDNPNYYTLLKLRKPTFNIPKTIKNYEEDENYLILPRGLTSKILDLFDKNSVKYELHDKRFFKNEHFGKVGFKLRDEQLQAVKSIQKQDFCLCVAPPGFGKTLIGAKMIELRGCNTLIIVNKNMLLNQWIDRFVEYFSIEKNEIGYLGKGKNKLNKKLDVATMQSLKNNPEIIQEYSQVIVDECHHIPAVTFEIIIKKFRGRYILGLSATPNRKDGMQPILFEQIGNIAYEHKKKKAKQNHLKIIRTDFQSRADNYSELISEICVDVNRNNLIIDQIIKNRHRKILVLTDRIEHINQLEELLKEQKCDFISVHGSQSKKEQTKNMQLVDSANLILATTSFFGEGIDFPHLDTIIFATPISYYGRVVQYLGRIGRGAQECLAIDFLDSKNAMLNSAFRKRKEGYKQMHYKVE